MAVSASGLRAAIGVAASMLHQRLIDDRIDKVRAIVDLAEGNAQFLAGEVTAGRLTREQAERRSKSRMFRRQTESKPGGPGGALAPPGFLLSFWIR
jgi:hypothetical protein